MKRKTRVEALKTYGEDTNDLKGVSNTARENINLYADRDRKGGICSQALYIGVLMFCQTSYWLAQPTLHGRSNFAEPSIGDFEYFPSSPCQPTTDPPLVRVNHSICDLRPYMLGR